MSEPVLIPTGGIVVPWDDRQPIAETTWSVKTGTAPDTEKMVFEVSYDYRIQDHVSWATEHWEPIRGKIQSPVYSYSADNVSGGPSIFRGTITPGVAFRVRIVEGTGYEIPVHVQVGTNSYVGVISTEIPFTFVIHEEMTVEDLFST